MIRRRLTPYGDIRVRPVRLLQRLRWGGAQMSAEWETSQSGPIAADRTVLLIPGGLSTAVSYTELMAEPALSGVHLVAVTLPGHGGAPPEDFSIETYARLAAGLAPAAATPSALPRRPRSSARPSQPGPPIPAPG